MTINTLHYLSKITFFLLMCSNYGFSQDPCASDDHRAFDFWLGDWEVYNPQGKLVGLSNIALTLDGCAIFETWESKGTYKGNSINHYDRVSKLWEQKWVDNFGVDLEFEGKIQGGEANYYCRSKDPKSGKRLYNHMIIKKENKDVVNQVWHQSSDSVNWKVIFDGTYNRISKHKALDEVYDSFSLAYKTLNPNLVADLYSESALYLKPRGITIGHDKILKNFTDFFNRLKERGDDPTIEFKIIHREIEGNLAADIGYYLLTYYNDAKVKSQHAGRFTTTLTKNINGKWQFVSDAYIDVDVEVFQNAKEIER